MKSAGKEYAQALYKLARDEGLEEKILAELDLLERAVEENPGFLRLLGSPGLPKEQRCAILDDSFKGKLHLYVLNCWKIMIRKGLAKHFPVCCKTYRQLYQSEHGIISVQATTAIPLTDSQIRKISGKLEKQTGKTVLLQNKVDPDCLGGVRLDYDGMRLDDTVKHRLEAVQKMLESSPQ